MKKEIKIGVVGYGGAFNMGRHHLLEAEQAGMVPAAVTDLDKSRLATAKEDFPGISTYTSVAEMLKKSEVDLVTIITPHNTHAKLAIQCATAGRHVVVEKPFAITTAECDRMISTAEKKKVVLSTYHNRHWDGCILQALKVIEKGKIGDVVRIEAHMGSWGQPREWWRSSKSISGGILYDWGVHLLEYSLQIVNSEITEVSGYSNTGFWANSTRWKADTNEDEAAAVVRFKSGAYINLRISAIDSNPKAGQLEITGTKGSYILDGRTWETVVAKKKSVVRENGTNPPSESWRYYQNLADHLTKKTPLVITPQWARRPVHILDLAVKRAQPPGNQYRQSMSSPNIILVMCDDLGYGDVGFNGNTVIETPYLDALASGGIRFTRFMAGGPVCSPTRGTCLTGRHYIRYGVTHANEGSLPAEEITLTGIVKTKGYRTGHFGKWHLGTLTRDEPDGNRGGRPDKRQFYAPPWERGFDVCFSNESKVPTWDPMVTPDYWEAEGAPYGTWYWNEKGQKVTDNLEGDDSRVIMDRALDFIQTSASGGTPFLAVIWFHTPHTPVVAGPEYLAKYSRFPENYAHYYGCVTAMDDQVGRLRSKLEELNIAEDTMLWFCSDNGPEGRSVGDTSQSQFSRSCGETGGLRGRKRSLYNGGIGVPGFLVWPRQVEPGRTVSAPCSTLDYLPTISEVLEYTMPDDRPIDGASLMPIIEGDDLIARAPIPYRFLSGKESMFGSPTVAVIDGEIKYLTNLTDSRENDECYNISDDPNETNNIIGSLQDTCDELRGFLTNFVDSARSSHAGADYTGDWEPITEFQEPSEW